MRSRRREALQLAIAAALLLGCGGAAGQAVLPAPLSLGEFGMRPCSCPLLQTQHYLSSRTTHQSLRRCRGGAARHPGVHHQLAPVCRRQQPERLGRQPVHPALPVHGGDVRRRRPPQLSVSALAGWLRSGCATVAESLLPTPPTAPPPLLPRTPAVRAELAGRSEQLLPPCTAQLAAVFVC